MTTDKKTRNIIHEDVLQIIREPIRVNTPDPRYPMYYTLPDFRVVLKSLYLILEFDQVTFNLHTDKLHRKPYFMFSNLSRKIISM
jgi:hypothetical protein